MHKWIFAVVIAVACGFGVYLMADGFPDKPADEHAGLAEGQELLRITATSFDFDKDEYVVQAGTNYKLRFSNKLGVHGFEIPELGIKMDSDNPEMDITFDAPGEYEFKCSIMCGQGHNDMVAKLIVQ